MHKRFSVIGDVAYLSGRLREADRMEVEALGFTPFSALMQGHLGDHCWTVEFNGEPVCMYGVNKGLVWLLGSDRLLENKTRFARQSLIERDRLLSMYPVLTNIVHLNNTIHVRWLKWLGAEFGQIHNEFQEFKLCVAP